MEKERELKALLGDDYEPYIAFRTMKWVGPLCVDELLDYCLDDSRPRIPESGSVYLISAKSWNLRPDTDCGPLYVGSNTGASPRFRTRVGDLIADMFGFFGNQTGHHSGGISIHEYCKQNNLHPKSLYIGWVSNCGCIRCAESYIHELLDPELNRNRPPKCKRHQGEE